jgi:hypothetical protein
LAAALSARDDRTYSPLPTVRPSAGHPASYALC